MTALAERLATLPPELQQGDFCIFAGADDKAPRAPKGGHLISANVSKGWTDLPTAIAHAPKGGGVGRRTSSADTLACIDLDKCLADDGTVINEHAIAVLKNMPSYTERSPSGTGLHVWVSIADKSELNNFQNHPKRVEFYLKNHYLTLTGDLFGENSRIYQPSARKLKGFYDAFKTSSPVDALPAPGLVDPNTIPELYLLLDEESHAYRFLTTGDLGTHRDRSAALAHATHQLYATGELGDAQVLTILAENPHAQAVARDHRGDDADKALDYLWRHHALRCRQSDPAAGFGPVPAGVKGPDPRPSKDWLAPADLRAQSYRRDWVIKGLIERQQVGTLFGPSGSLKSFAAIDLSTALASGSPWGNPDDPDLHLKLNPGPAFYLAGEGETGIKRRFEAAARKYDLQAEDVPYRLSAHKYLLNDPKQLMRFVRSIDAECEALGTPPALITVDTVSKSFTGNEDKAEDVAPFIRGMINSLALRYSCSVLLIHHSGHANTQRMKGSVNFLTDVDFTLRAERTASGTTIYTGKMKEDGGAGALHFRADVLELERYHDEVFDEEEVVTSLQLHRVPAPVEEVPGAEDLKGFRADAYRVLANERDGMGLERETVNNLMPHATPKQVSNALAALRRLGLVKNVSGRWSLEQGFEAVPENAGNKDYLDE